MIDNNSGAVEPILSHNEKVTPMYGARMWWCEKLMVEVLSILTVDGIFNILCELTQERYVKCAIG